MAVEKKLITNVAIVGIATLVLGAVSYYIIDNLVNFWIPELEDHDHLVSAHLEMRRHEKDFLARDTLNPVFFETGQSQYLDAFLEEHDEIDPILERIEAAEAAEADEEFTETVEEAHENLDVYAHEFLEVAEKYRERGMLGYGVVGELDGAGAGLQESVAGDSGLSMLAADIRLQEKNYLITRDSAYHENALQDIAALRSGMETASLETAGLDAYTAAFGSLVKIDDEIGRTPDEGLMGSYRAAAHGFEVNVAELHEDVEAEIGAATSTYIAIILVIAGVIVAFNFGVSTIIFKQVSIIVQKVVDHDKQESEMRKKVEEAHNVLIATEKSKDEFISMVSHELRTPIVPIKLYTDMLLKTKSMGELNEKQRKALSSVQKGTDRLEMLIGDIFDVYKLDIGKLKFSMSDNEIQSLVDQNIAELKSYTVEKQISLKTDLKASGTVWCDPKRVGQVFFNLVKNSVDFVPAGTGEITIRAEDGYDSQVTFTVQDNGPGIPAEKIDKLFQKFYQADTSATRKHGGSGLGLAVCKGIVEAHGGTIWVDKTFTKGAVIKFTLPRRKVGQ